MKRHAWIRVPVALLSLALLQGSAAAQEEQTGFALNRFNPSERGSEWFTLDSLDLRGNSRWAAGAVMDWAYKPLVVYEGAGAEVGPVITNQAFLHLGGSVVFLDRLRIGVNLPVAFYQSGADQDTVDYSFNAPDKSAMGDIRLSADVRLVGKYGDPFTAALGAAVFLPTGSPELYTGDGGVRLLPRLSIAGEIKNFVYAANLGFEYRSGVGDDFGGNANGSEIRFGAAAGMRLLNKKLVLGPELFGSAVVAGSSLPTAVPPVEVLFGGHYTAGEVRIGLGAGPGLTRGIGEPTARVALSLEWTPGADDGGACSGKGDRDGDNICDDVDACPDRAGVWSAEPWRNGCPVCATGDSDSDGICNELDACPMLFGPPNIDRAKNGCPTCAAGDPDADGICSDVDACPNEFGLPNPDPRKHGCPGQCANQGGDTDGDGICNHVDACPNLIGVASVDPTKNGCPAQCLQNGGDGDGDGICSDVDACPKDYGFANSDPKEHGCPQRGTARIICSDRDRDGICDYFDVCPTVFGDPSPDPKLNGCPAKPNDTITLVLDSTVLFRFDKDAIDPTQQSEDVLRGVLRVLTAHPEYVLLHVEAHTDSMGTDAYNMALSKRRAASVVKWLAARGVPASYLMSEGFGEGRPIATNTTDEGRAKNRRVEIHVERIDPSKRPPPMQIDTVIKKDEALERQPQQ